MKRNYQIVKRDRKGLDAIKFPTAIDVAWAAGIYEGEGSCVTTNATAASKSFNVCVAQKDPEMLFRMRDLFGGTISNYERTFNGKVCPISHWKICGDRARTFIAVVYPFLTARRKEQIEATPAGSFIEQVQDLLRFDVAIGPSKVYESLWSRINEYNAAQRATAYEHKRKREAEWYAEQSKDPLFMEKKRLAQQERRKLRKEQSAALSAPKLVAIA